MRLIIHACHADPSSSEGKHLPCMASTFVFSTFLADSRVGALIEIHQSDSNRADCSTSFEREINGLTNFRSVKMWVLNLLF